MNLPPPPISTMNYMVHCLSLARRSLGLSSPNPAVGAVVIKDGEVIGEGSTRPPGQSHAEIVALQQAGAAAAGAEVYVTLEPCCFAGRTPPCTTAIINSGIVRVHVATLDPNPRVSGKGVQELRNAGIEVVLGECRKAADHIVEGYAKYISTGMPFVTAKFAASLDGKIATHAGDSKWITGPDARARAHLVRSSVDGVIVGSGTVNADNPKLTARNRNGALLDRQPVRIVVGGSRPISPDSQVFDNSGRVIFAAPHIPAALGQCLTKKGVELIRVPASDRGVDLSALLKALGEREITTLLVEGGGALLGSFFDDHLVEKVVAFIAPVIIGGEGSIGAVGGRGPSAVADAFRLSEVDVENLHPDIIVTGYLKAQPNS